MEDTGVSLEVINAFFGANIAHLVDGVTKLSGLESKSKEEIQAGPPRPPSKLAGSRNLADL